MLQHARKVVREAAMSVLIKLMIGLTLAVLPFAAAPATAAPSQVGKAPHGFKFLEQRGPYSVGLRVVEQYDYSRIFKPPVDAMGKPTMGERARPLQTLIWYPAVQSNAKPMTFGDYVAFGATETSFGQPRLTDSDERAINSMKPSLGQEMWAVRDAPLERNRFPIVVYAPSFSSVSWENVDLCEYLASHGYVVISSPAMGVTRDSTHDVAGTNAQARDISFLIGFARSLPDVDMSEVAVVGFSWGGLAELFAAARDDRIRALVALDGSMRYFPWVVQKAGDIDPDRMTIPLLYFAAQATLEDEDRFHRSEMTLAPNVLNDWIHGDLLTIHMLGLVHPEFVSLAHRNENFWTDEFSKLQEADYSREDGAIGYAWMARYVRAFLDAYLKHDGAAAAFIKNTPAANGVPAHLMGAQFRSASGAPASPNSPTTH